ncbi:ATP-binding cassette domain-containing protein [Marinicella sp. S1101]|uniref:ATP-binding cassette domain-containing protein n=1 Tax=Marinicella marina TaxID=2996016 RepID=UPI002260EDD9|nr:ATP-binding cassette domain-containing protein [Marinicella marina]MCX7553760.1 ATP-binding cassette domain-containing protein [Marinicella marina]MDJ1140835.1 ATP-binding cassette domain-containing protein [Marinicella marina]
MSLLSFDQVSIDFGAHPILDAVGLTINKGQKLALIGRNGEGKSTLLKIMAGDIPIDDGQVIRQDGLKVAMMKQSAVNESESTVRQFLLHALGEVGHALEQYETATDPDAMAKYQHTIEENNGWELLQQIDVVTSKLKLNADDVIKSLSGGVRRRINLAAALVQMPDILLLDEPTNHLDIESILWLQDMVNKLHCAVVFVTHDRTFLRSIANGILELDRGKIYQYDCDYNTYLKRREERLDAEVKEWERLDKKLSQEEVWVRQGIKARRTRSESRVKDLLALREERKNRRTQSGSTKASINVAEASGKKVIVTHNLGFKYGDQTIVEGLTTKIMRGDKVGIIGPNGVGKTTLVQLLLGEIEPQMGSVKLGTNLEIAYFDQLKASINDDDTVENNLQLGTDFVEVNGKPRHVISYLQDFLFSAEKIRGPASVLSGGERSRLLLARLFARPANVIVMDEPTNDLDMETLDLIQDLLFEFKGTLILISHDRDFIDNVCTQTLVFENPVEGKYEVNEYIGGYEDYLRQRRKPEVKKPVVEKKAQTVTTQVIKTSPANKLTFKEKHELEQLPAEIDGLETEIETMSAEVCDPDFYTQDEDKIKQTTTALAALEKKLQAAYDRWDELEAKD